MPAPSSMTKHELRRRRRGVDVAAHEGVVARVGPASRCRAPELAEDERSSTPVAAFASMSERSIVSPPATPTPWKAVAPSPARMMSRARIGDRVAGVEVGKVLAAGPADQDVEASWAPVSPVVARPARAGLSAAGPRRRARRAPVAAEHGVRCRTAAAASSLPPRPFSVLLASFAFDVDARRPRSAATAIVASEGADRLVGGGGASCRIAGRTDGRTPTLAVRRVDC